MKAVLAFIVVAMGLSFAQAAPNTPETSGWRSIDGCRLDGSLFRGMSGTLRYATAGGSLKVKIDIAGSLFSSGDLRTTFVPSEVRASKDGTLHAVQTKTVHHDRWFFADSDETTITSLVIDPDGFTLQKDGHTFDCATIN